MTAVTSARIAEAAARLRNTKSLVVLTGAGVSKESGVPTFRDAMDGLWAKYDPTELGTPEAFRRNPKLVWDWYEHRRKMLDGIQPNPGHLAMAALETLVPQVVVITQNVDGLHHAAGSADVIRLHGDITRHKCFFNCEGDPTPVDIRTLEWDIEAGPPACPYCGRWVRPDVVWFTEHLPAAALSRALDLAHTCDTMLVVGTSGVVQPAAMLPYEAKHNGAYVIDVNPVPDEITPIADLFLEGPSGQVLPRVIEAMQSRTP